MKKTAKEKTRLFLISTTIVVLVVVLVSSVYRDFMNILDNNREITKLSEDYERLLTVEEKTKSEVIKLQNSDNLARYAKEKFLYSSEGEILIRMD